MRSPDFLPSRANGNGGDSFRSNVKRTPSSGSDFHAQHDAGGQVQRDNGSQTPVLLHKNRDGSRVYSGWRDLPGGQRRLEAYKLTVSKKAGTETRLYTDGSRVISGKGFTETHIPGHLTVTTFANGTKMASLPNGTHVFEENLGSLRDARGIVRPAIYRHVNYRVRGGRAYALREPVTEVYLSAPVNGVMTYAYSPWAAPDGYYDPFLVTLNSKMTVADICNDCGSAGVEFSRGWFSSAGDNDPAGLLAEAVIITEIKDAGPAGDSDHGPNDPPPDQQGPGIPVNEPENAAMQKDIQDLRGQVQSEDAQIADLQDQNAQLQDQNAQLQNKVSALQADAGKTKVKISSEIREQVKKQVKEQLARAKTHEVLEVSDVIAAASATQHVFLMSKKVSAGSCSVYAGGALKFASLPSKSDVALTMVVAANDQRAGACAQGTNLKVTYVDLQESLNAFAKNLEYQATQSRDRVLTAQKSGGKAGSG